MTSQPQPSKKPLWLRPWFLILAAILVIGGVAQAFGGGTAEPAAAPSQPASSTSTPQASPPCLKFPMDRARDILDNKKMIPDEAMAVRSVEHDQAYYIAIRFHGPGVDSEVGIWATSDLQSGSIRSVDGFASQFSDFPKHENFSVTDKGANQAKACIKG